METGVGADCDVTVRGRRGFEWACQDLVAMEEEDCGGTWAWDWGAWFAHVGDAVAVVVDAEAKAVEPKVGCNTPPVALRTEDTGAKRGSVSTTAI